MLVGTDGQRSALEASLLGSPARTFSSWWFTDADLAGGALQKRGAGRADYRQHACLECVLLPQSSVCERRAREREKEGETRGGDVDRLRASRRSAQRRCGLTHLADRPMTDQQAQRQYHGARVAAEPRRIQTCCRLSNHNKDGRRFRAVRPERFQNEGTPHDAAPFIFLSGRSGAFGCWPD
jgi:hypothetical protein